MQLAKLRHFPQWLVDSHRRFRRVRQDYPDLKTCQIYSQFCRQSMQSACGSAANCQLGLFSQWMSHSSYSCCTCNCSSTECQIRNTHSTSSDTRIFCRHTLLYAIYRPIISYLPDQKVGFSLE